MYLSARKHCMASEALDTPMVYLPEQSAPTRGIGKETHMPMRTDAAYARGSDRQDDLAAFRDEFVIDDPDLIYLDGNSLGRLPRRAAVRMREAVEREWGERLIRGWGDGWFGAPQRIGAKLARLV